MVGDVAGEGVVGEGGGGALVELLGQLLHALPRHEQRRRDDQHHRRAEQDLALGRQPLSLSVATPDAIGRLTGRALYSSDGSPPRL